MKCPRCGSDPQRMRFDDHSVMRDNKEIDVLAIRKDTKELVVAECKTSIPVEDLDDLIEGINFKVDCVRESSRFKDLRILPKSS